jgi:anti-sigma regulatory factor (Ser/Thr protein kinase)
MNVHLALHLHSHLGQDECCVDHPETLEPTTNGVAMSVNQLGQLPTRTRIDPAAREPLDLSARLECGSGRPRVVRMPADWWDSPSAVGCPLGRSAHSARMARRLTRNTLRDWGLVSLIEDAETIVGEFVANAVTHATAAPAGGFRRSNVENLGLRLLRRTGEVMCAVLDPSDVAPVLRVPGGAEEAGRGLQMVDALSDVWGWSPVAGRGKAVWAILFCA